MAVVPAIKGIPKIMMEEIALAMSTGVIFLDFCLLSGSLILLFAASIICSIHCIISDCKVISFFIPGRFPMIAAKSSQALLLSPGEAKAIAAQTAPCVYCPPHDDKRCHQTIIRCFHYSFLISISKVDYPGITIMG
jgi:hypothetical protein